MKTILIGALFIGSMWSLPAYAQKLLGIVFEKDTQGKEQPLPGVNVHWLGTNTSTRTGDNGVFLIDRDSVASKLVVSFVGYRTDTISTIGHNEIKIELKLQAYLNEVTVESWKPSTSVDYTSVINRNTITEKELFKAACCNLSESFETNTSVDVAFTDAITGTRQIQMLGLSGPNTSILIENMPGVRGLASSQGIQFIPGAWINSIQVTKGVGSVINGYESIAGQMNVELKKPQESDKLYLNGYLNASGRTETNVIYSTQAGKKWATTFLLHGNVRPVEIDQNHDGFLDFPVGKQINFVNRWVYHSGTGWLAQMSIKYLNDDKRGGQRGFDLEKDKFTTNRYGFDIKTSRTEFAGKLGYQFPGKPYKSIGLQLNGTYHVHESFYGFNDYQANERSVYANLIYQSIIGTSANKFKTGLSFLYDGYHETLIQRAFSLNAIRFNRHEVVPGAFLEYAYDNQGKFSLIAGARVDQHNLFGTLFVPRLHLKYDLTQTTTLRASAGKGFRVANIIAENSGFLASSRALTFSGARNDNAYGFKPDQALNYGINLVQDFTLDYRTGIISADYFFTDFKNQAIIDLDHDTRQANFFALTGKSFSQTVQIQVDYQLARRFDIRVAYRWLDVKTDYLDGRRARPLIPHDRAFVNLAYKTKNSWIFDYTVQRIGRQRIPSTSASPASYQLAPSSPAYFIMNAQITKDIGQKWSGYVGAENITNYYLKTPIVSANEPFGPYFDTSMVWGPVFGRMWYVGFRYRIK